MFRWGEMTVPFDWNYLVKSRIYADDILYDPTNGTTSHGDLVATNAGFFNL